MSEWGARRLERIGGVYSAREECGIFRAKTDGVWSVTLCEGQYTLVGRAEQVNQKKSTQVKR